MEGTDFMNKSMQIEKEEIKGQWLSPIRKLFREVKVREQRKVEDIVLLGAEGKNHIQICY